MTSVKILTSSFFDRPTPEVAREMLGKWLCRRMSDGEILRMRISETEAYDGHEDKACHAHNGKTPRNEVMFGKAGFWYVYLCYGMHWMLNVVTGPIDFPAAVLVRGCVGIARRPRAWVLELLCGVGKLAWSGRTDSPSNRPRHVACGRPASVRSETSHHSCLGSSETRGAG